jgi:hypothetical protein
MRILGMVGLASLAAFAAACGSSGDSFEKDHPPPPGGVQLVTPTFTVPKGTEVFECFRVPYDVKEDLYVQSSAAWQATGGHHTMLYYSVGTAMYKDAPHTCDSTDMLDVRFIGVGTAAGGGITMPPGVVLKIPAGVKIYAQSHYLNATEKDLTAKDLINLELIPQSKVQNVAGAWTEIQTGLQVPPNDTASAVVSCSPPVEMTVPWLIPHMHEFGQHFNIELTSDGKTSTLYDSDWVATLRDHFPLVTFDQQPLKLKPSDIVKTTCTWKNTTSAPLLWPREMCAMFMIYYPSTDGALWACDHDGANFRP